jgi:DNA-binding LytR/AlgR family response regulator
MTLQMPGDWDAADAELAQDADALADDGFLACHRGWLAALRVVRSATPKGRIGRLGGFLPRGWV